MQVVNAPLVSLWQQVRWHYADRGCNKPEYRAVIRSQHFENVTTFKNFCMYMSHHSLHFPRRPEWNPTNCFYAVVSDPSRWVSISVFVIFVRVLLHFRVVVTVTTVASTCPGQIHGPMFLSHLTSNTKISEEGQNLIYSILLSHTRHLFADEKLSQYNERVCHSMLSY